MKKYRLKMDCLVMDKGFYSQENIKGMHEKGFKYLVPMSFSTKLSIEILNDLNEKLASPMCSFLFQESVYSYYKKEIQIGKKKCIAHVYLDKKRKAEQESRLIKKVSELEEKFQGKNFSSYNEAKLYLEETLKSRKKYFNILEEKTGFLINRNEKVFKDEILKMGSLILITNHKDLNKHSIINLYRKKDCVEKVFLSFKHDINEKRSRTHSLINMRGSIFINFISLILITWIDHVMKEKQLYKNISKGQLFKILDRLKLYELATEETMLGEISKKQKDIFSAYKISKNVKPSKNFG
jgi:transposase